MVAKVGKVAYKLGLSESSSIHPMFHVSQLKLDVTPDKVISSLPQEFDRPRVPEVVLHSRTVERNGSEVQQVLIKWSNWPDELATWVDHVSM